MIPIGAQVCVTDTSGGRWPGTVTGHPSPYSIEIDGRLIAPANMAKVVGMTEEPKLSGPQMQELADLEYNLHLMTEERDGLQEIIVMQCEAMAAIPTATQIAEQGALAEGFQQLREAVADFFLENLGTYNPTPMDAGGWGRSGLHLVELMREWK